jgi:hypothetical protein
VGKKPHLENPPKKVVEQYPISFSFVCGAVSFDLVEQYLLILWSSIPLTLPERIYNPITAMGFSAMFIFQLNNTKR